MPTQALLDRLTEAFRAAFDRGGDAAVGAPTAYFAPGRVNLLGAHLDYSGGEVLPVAVHLGVYALARLRDDDRIRMVSTDRDGVIDLEGAMVGARASGAERWASYAVGVWRGFADRVGEARGVDIAYTSDLPIASGMSSSAAFEIVTACALDDLHGTGIPAIELAQLAHDAETGFVGVPCGIMDQYASALAGGGRVLRLRCSDRRIQHIGIEPGSVDILVVDTKKPRSLAEGGGFEERVRQCREAHRVLNTEYGERGWLVDFTIDEVERASAALGPVLYKRARHVAGESERVRRGAEALQAGDLEAFGVCVTASHESTRVDYEVSCAELDVVVESATAAGALGARLTGAGFGGCAVVLARSGTTPVIERAVREAFVSRFGVEPDFHLLRPGPLPGPLRPSPG